MNKNKRSGIWMLGTIKNGQIFGGFSEQKEEEVKERDPWSPPRDRWFPVSDPLGINKP